MSGLDDLQADLDQLAALAEAANCTRGVWLHSTPDAHMRALRDACDPPTCPTCRPLDPTDEFQNPKD